MAASDELTNFFQFLWNDTDSLVHLKTRDSQNSWRQFFFQWPRDHNKLIHNVQLWSAEGKEVFVCPALYKDSAVESCRQAKLSGGRWDAKADALGSHVLWTDFDGNAPSEWPAEPTGDLPTPSLRVRSSTSDRQHAYWKLDHLETDTEAIETKNRSLAYLLDADKSGWDISQLLRPPGTVNHGYGKEERKGKTYEVVTEDTTEHTYQLDFFDPRPISKEKLGAILTNKIFLRQFRFSHDIVSLICSTSASFAPSMPFPTKRYPMRIARLDTLVLRRGLMMRRYTLSYKTPMPVGESIFTVETGINV